MSELKRADFQKIGEVQSSTVTVYLIPIRQGEIWLKHTLIDDDDDDDDELAAQKNETPWSLTYIFSVGKNHIITGKEFASTFEKLVKLLEDCGYNNFPGIDHLKKRSFKNYKQKFVRSSDNVECNFCVSELGPFFYYQHASLKFDCGIGQDTIEAIAHDLMKIFNLCPGRSSVLECVRRFFPNEYKSIRDLDYDGQILGDCFPPVNYLTTFDYATEADENEKDENETDECHDIRFILDSTEDFSVDRFLKKLSNEYNYDFKTISTTK